MVFRTGCGRVPAAVPAVSQLVAPVCCSGRVLAFYTELYSITSGTLLWCLLTWNGGGGATDHDRILLVIEVKYFAGYLDTVVKGNKSPHP